MGCLRYLGLSAAGLMGLHSVASAQQGDRLNIGFSNGVIYDTNLARARKEVAAARGLFLEDLRVSPSAHLEAALPLGTSRLFADARLGYDFHKRNKQLNRERIQAHVGGEARSGACAVTLEGSGIRQQSELEDITFEPAVNTETIFDTTLSVSCPREGRLSPSLSVNHRTLRNDRPLRRNVDNDVNGIQGGLRFDGAGIADLDLTLSYRRVDFPGRRLKLSSDPSETDGYQVYQAGLQMSRDVGSLVRGSARIAYTQVDVKGQRKPFSGNTFGIDLGFFPYGKIQPHITIERSLDPVNRLDVLYRVQLLARVETVVRLTPRIRMTGTGSWRDTKYRLAIDFPGQVEREKTWFGGVTVDFDVSPKFTAALFAQRENRDTNLPIFGFDSKRVGLSTRLIF